MLGGLALAGCDLEPKNLGNESDDNGGSAEDSGSGESGGGDEDSASMSTTADPTGIEPVCEDGDTMMQDCNTCSCYEGQWACTEIGCDPTEEPPVECEDGDMMMQDCNTCSCYEGHWACTDIACQPPGNGIAVCDEFVPRDALDISGIALAGDTVLVELGYGGGCAEHILSGCWSGLFAESEPVQVWAFVSHESNDDNCDAYITESIEVDLAPLKAAYQEAYQTDHGTIRIHLDGWQPEIVYEF